MYLFVFNRSDQSNSKMLRQLYTSIKFFVSILQLSSSCNSIYLYVNKTKKKLLHIDCDFFSEFSYPTDSGFFLSAFF